MRSLLLLAPVLLLAACDKPAPPPSRTVEAPKAPAPATAPQAEPRNEGGDNAAAALRHYYDLIESRRYDDAYAMRSGQGVDAKRFAENFRAYEDYHVQLGAPSQVATQDGYDFAEVPVMITGRFVGGKSFGSTGRVMLRRARSGGDRGWKILAQ